MNTVLLFFTNTGFSISAICICLCVIFSYFFKNRKEKLEERSRYFILVLCSIIVMSLVEIGYVLYYLNVGEDGRYATLLYQLYFISILFTTFFSWAFVITYRLFLNSSDPKRNVLKRIFFALIVLIEVVIVVLLFVMPVEIYTNYGIYAFKSVPITVTLIYVFVSTSMFVALLYAKNDSITRRDLYPSVVSLVIVVLFLAHRLITGIDINIETFQLTIFALGIFFTIENQDYVLLNMAKQKQEDAENATTSQKDFLANMSHQIRSPMNTIMGLSQLLLEQDNITKESVREDITNIHEASVSLLSLINNISDYSHVLSEKEEIVNKKYDVRQMIFEVNSNVEEKIKSDDVSFSCNVSKSVPNELVGDSERIAKVLFNVLTSALANTKSGQVQLEVTGNPKKNDIFEYVFTIKLPGKSRESLDVDNAESAFGLNMDSESLGMLVAKNLAEAMNGKLEYLKEENGYLFTLEQQSEEKLDPKTAKVEKEEEKPFDLAGKRILVAEENETKRNLVKIILEKYNAKVDVCKNGEEAVDTVKNNHYDVIFLADQLPVFDGVLAYDKIKDLKLDIPKAILMVDTLTTEDKELYNSKGFSDCLVKPIEENEIKKVLTKILENETSLNEGGVSNE